MLKVSIFQPYLSITASIVEKALVLRTTFMSTSLIITEKIKLVIDLDSHLAGSETDVLLNHIDKLPTETGWKYSCSLCGKENVQKANVVKHVESVHFPNLFSYQCKFCSKQFSARNSLYAHVSRNHKN